MIDLMHGLKSMTHSIKREEKRRKEKRIRVTRGLRKQFPVCVGIIHIIMDSVLSQHSLDPLQ